VPRGTARLRISLSAAHSTTAIQQLADAIGTIHNLKTRDARPENSPAETLRHLASPLMSCSPASASFQ
jgi:hypothetical protein